MTDVDVISKFDHTLLKVDMTERGIDELCKEAVLYGTASVCIPPCYVSRAKNNLNGSGIKVCTVIGFPNGYSTTESKVFECEQAVKLGADEIDMVINVSQLKSGNYGYVQSEIKLVREACLGKTLKVIVETGALTESEKRTVLEIVTVSGADYIKTSTGFSKAGASLDDVRLMRANVGKNVLVKAAGGISGLQDAAEFLNAGASRLGTSRVVKAVQGIESKGY